MSEPKIKVTRAFRDQFNAVVAYYGCPPDEVEIMRGLVRKDPAGAATCYAALTKEIEDIHNSLPIVTVKA